MHVPMGSGSEDWQWPPAQRTEGPRLLPASKAEQERERQYLNRLTASSLLHVGYEANWLHVGKKMGLDTEDGTDTAPVSA